jgi:hypothetical protein
MIPACKVFPRIARVPESDAAPWHESCIAISEGERGYRDPSVPGWGEHRAGGSSMLARTIIAVTMLLAAAATQARDNGQYAQVDPVIKRWVEGLTDHQGRGCCATADGFRPEEVQWDMAESAYRVMIGGKWFTVPEGAVITESNRIGYAIVWYYVNNGEVFIRCFLPGSGA